MNTITRFNPSVTGNIHLGHAYCLLVNEKFAHHANGKFYIRFDDTSQAIYIEMEHRERLGQILENQQKDMEWLGLKVDGWQKQSDMQDDIRDELLYHYHFEMSDPYPHTMPVSIRMGADWIPYPYTPYQTAERVLMDHHLGVSHLIRGDDFFIEYALYHYFCDVFHIKMPEYILLPKLENIEGKNISKTAGGYTLTELRGKGYTPEDVIGLLEEACLSWRWNGWSLYNLKQSPRLGI